MGCKILSGFKLTLSSVQEIPILIGALGGKLQIRCSRRVGFFTKDFIRQSIKLVNVLNRLDALTLHCQDVSRHFASDLVRLSLFKILLTKYRDFFREVELIF